jgi:hypothetical protein
LSICTFYGGYIMFSSEAAMKVFTRTDNKITDN